jgi:hypothetical protein
LKFKHGQTVSRYRIFIIEIHIRRVRDLHNIEGISEVRENVRQES